MQKSKLIYTKKDRKKVENFSLSFLNLSIMSDLFFLWKYALSVKSQRQSRYCQSGKIFLKLFPLCCAVHTPPKPRGSQDRLAFKPSGSDFSQAALTAPKATLGRKLVSGSV